MAYLVTRFAFIKIISASDVSFLKSTNGHDLTLVTCDVTGPRVSAAYVPGVNR